MDLAVVVGKFGGNYEVTPALFKMGIHKIFGEHVANRFAGKRRVLDACVGGGFSTIPLARIVDEVVAVDTDERHLRYAQRNATIANLANVSFILGDVSNVSILERIGEVDGAYLDPEWVKGGCVENHEKCDHHATRLAETFPRADQLLDRVGTKTKDIALRLPRNFHLDELRRYPDLEIEASYLNEDLKFFTVYFGALVKKIGLTEFKASS